MAITRYAFVVPLIVLLIGAMPLPVLAIDLEGTVPRDLHRVSPGSESDARRGAQTESSRFPSPCDDGLLDNAYYQKQGYVYGNAFNVGAGYLFAIDFWHSGWQTLQGPYNYNIRVFDETTCTEIAAITGLQAADAYSTDEEEIQGLAPYNVWVTGLISVLIEPLSCATPEDCYPCVYFDWTEPMNGCGRVFPLTDPQCVPYDNRDFVLRIDVEGPGACCFPDRCEVREGAWCGALGGTYLGPGTTCTPDPCSTTSIDWESPIPSSLHSSASPNPATGDITIQFALPTPTTVTIEIFSAGGSLVRRIEEGDRPAGRHAVTWDSRDAAGRALPSGVYLARITTASGASTARVVVAK